MTKRKKATPAEERKRFIAAARELGCEEELPVDFNDIARKLAEMPPMSNAEVQRKAKQRRKKRKKPT